MAWRNFQQLIHAVACSMVFITGQLQTYTGDFYRNCVVAGQLRCAFQMLVGACFITALLRGFGSQQIVHHRLFSVIGIFRHQLFNLLIIAFRQFQQRLFGLLTCTATLTPDKPPTGVRASAEDPPQ